MLSTIFIFYATATTEIYTLSLHDALPTSVPWPIRYQRTRCPTFIVRPGDRKSTRLNSSHVRISYAVFCLKKKNEHGIMQLLAESSVRDRPADAPSRQSATLS